MMSDLSVLTARAQIQQLEDELLKQPQVDIPVTHHLPAGLYAREITIPAGVMVTGKVHLEEHLNIISAGEISILTEDGVKRIKAPYTMISRPGTKRVGYAHTDTVWTTVHANPQNETEIAALEDRLVVTTQADYAALQEAERKLLEGEHTCHL